MRQSNYVTLFFFLFTAIQLSAQEPRLIQPAGHTGGIDMAEYSPDGKYILTASHSNNDRTARLWETGSGKLIYTLNEHVTGINKLQFSPDGKYILTLAGVGYLWNAATGELLTILDSLTTRDAVFSPDGKYIAYVKAYQQGVMVWEVASRKIVRETAAGDDYDHVAFSGDGRQIFTYAYFSRDSHDSSTIGLWDITTGKQELEHNAPVGTLSKVTFSHNNKLLAVNLSSDMLLFDIATGELLGTDLSGSRETDNTIFSAGDSLLLFSSRMHLFVWDIAAGKTRYDVEGREAWINGLAITPDNKSFITIDHEGFFSAWDFSNGQKRSGSRFHEGSANGLLVSPDKKNFVTYGYDNVARIWQFSDYSLQRVLAGATARIASVRFTPDSTKLIAVDDNNIVRVTDLATGKLLRTLPGHTREIAELHLTPDGKKIMTNSYDSTLRLWDIETGRELYAVKPVSYQFYKTAIHPSGNSFVTWEALDDKLTFWDLHTGREKSSQKVVSTSFTAHAIQYTHNGKYLLINEGGSLQGRDGIDGKLLKTLPGGKAAVTAIDISPDDKLAAAVADSLVTVWEIVTGKKLVNQVGITSPYYPESFVTPAHNSVQFSPDGKRVLTAADDATAKVFDVQTGKQVLMLDSTHYLRIKKATYTNNGKRIITLGADDYMVVWDAVTGQPVRALGNYAEDITDTDLHPGNNYVVSATGSNLVIYNLETGGLLYKSLFIDRDDWLVVDSSDRYDGTEVARKLLYFTCAREIIELEQVKDQLWVPNLAERITKGESIGSKTLKQLDICGLTPQVENRSDAGAWHFIITPRRGGLGETVLLVNGIEVRRYTPAQLVKKEAQYELRLSKEELKDLLIDGQENQVSVKAFTTGNAISSRGLIISEDKTRATAAAPNLYAVMVGVSDYKGDELDLKYAAKDATDISKAVAGSARKLLNQDGKEHVFMYNLTTAPDPDLLPEKNNIRKTLEEIGKKATANDILMIFFAGHGVMEGENKQFYFLTADASKTSAAEAVAESGISTAELTEWMKPQNIKAQKRILIFDACNSGQAIKDFVKLGTGDQEYLAARNDDNAQQVKAIDKLNEKSGLFILSASASNQSAYEMGRYAQGLLTYSLLKAIKQQPDILEDGKFLNISRWFNAAEKTVTELSKESGARQEPQIVTNTNFNIGIVDDDVISRIVLPQEKPLFAASNFQNSDEAVADDDLELSKMINLQLSDRAARGTESKIVYVTATNSPDAYSLSGRYLVKGDAVTVTVNIKQNKTIRSKFELSGTKNKLGELAAAIADKAAGQVK